MGRAPCCDKTKVKRGPWSPQEDTTLKDYIHQFGTGGNWIALPQKAGLKRCGKSCRLRWLNYLRPDIKHGGFTEEEDNIILTLYHNIGSRWSVIASHLKGRTDNDVKNYWNTKLKKKILLGPNPSPNNNSFNITTNHTMHLSSTTPSPPFVPKVGNYYGIVSDFPNVNYQQTQAPQEPVADPFQASLPRLMEVRSTSAISPISQEVSSLSPWVENRSGLWYGNGEGHGDDGFLMGLVGRSSSFSSYDLLNDFGVLREN